MLNTNGTVYDSYSTINRDNITDPKNGLVIFNTDNKQLEINLGTPEIPNWQPVVPAPEDLCDLTLTPLEVTLGSLQTYTLLGDTSTIQPDYGVIQLSPPVVIVPGVVELSRDAGGGQIYNAVNESTAGGPYDNDWPSDTEWNSVFTDPVNYGFADLTNVKNRTYNNFVNANNGFGTFPGPTGVGNNVVGLELVCHVISTDQYFKFTFTSWDKGNNPPGGPWGGFVVDVQEITVSDPCEITFSDGTTQTTAPVPTPPTQICGFPFSDILPTDTVTICRDNGEGGYDNFSAILPNTWDVRSVAFLSTFGNDTTAVVGDGNKPYRTFSAAQAAASVIFVKDGSWSTETIVSNKTYYFYPGTQMYRLRDGGATVTNTKILGKLKFRSFGYGVELTGSNSDVYVECDEFDNVRVICFAYNGSSLHIKCRRAFANGSWGGGFATSARDGGSILLEVTERCTVQYWLNANRGANTSFTLRCPDVRQQPGGIFGATGFGSLVSYQGSVTQGGEITIDFMGGKLTRTRAQGSSFGVRDSALVLVVNCFGGNPTPIVKVQNGYVDAASTLGVLIEYIVLRIHYELNNIKLKTTSKPIEMSQRAVNLGGWTQFCNFVANNCSFEGDLDNELGNCRIARFFNCNFKTLTGVSNFTFNASNGASPGEAYFVNCNAELVGGPGELLTGFAGVTLGLLNTNHDEPLGVGATDTWGGANLVPTLTLPNLEL